MCSAVLLPVPPSSSTRIHYCPLGLIELCEARHGFAKSTEEAASIYPVVEPIDATSCVVLRSHVSYVKLIEPERLIVDRWITGWSPSDVTYLPILYKDTNCVHLLLLRTLFPFNYNENNKESALFLLKTLKLFTFEFLRSNMVVKLRI